MLTDLQLVDMLIVLFKEKEWIQGTNAANGRFTRNPTDWDANRFCIRGACIRILAPDRSLMATAFTMDSPISAQIPRALGFKTNQEVVSWNDAGERTFIDVEKLLRRRKREIPIEEARREAERLRKAELATQHAMAAASRRYEEKKRTAATRVEKKEKCDE